MNSKKLIIRSLFGAAIFGTLFFSSCEKKSEIETAANNEEATADDSQEADAIGNESQNIADAYYANANSAQYRNEAIEIAEASGCATVTHDSINKGLLTIDFGLTNCLCKDGVNRRGKIIVNYTGGKYKTTGAKRTITFDNFYRNDNKIEGTRTITNMGINGNGNYHWDIEASNMKITRVDGKIHTWTSKRDREMTAGFNTIVISDDEYNITGSTSGENKNKIKYSATITKALHRSMACKWFDSGVIEFINASNGKTRTLDYGNGTCDNTATVTVTAKNGKTTTKTITLK